MSAIADVRGWRIVVAMFTHNTSSVVVSLRAVRRLQAEFPHLTGGQAASYIQQLFAEGSSRSTPRRWMRPGLFKPGTRFVYSHFEPDFCVVVRGGVAINVVVRGDRVVRPAQHGPARTEIARFDWRSIDFEEVA
jgi:hypothetical protein